MKKTIAIIAAIGLSSAAYADHHMQDDAEGNLIPIPSSSNTETYDGPNSEGAPGQPAPTESDARLASPGGNYTAQTRSEYPFCSAEVRDNCRQRRDPSY